MNRRPAAQTPIASVDEAPPSDPLLSSFNRLVLESPRRLGMPIAVYPGLVLTQTKVRDVVTNAQAQFEAAAALHERYNTPFALSAMDLSVEAEAFGCEARFSDNEVPYVMGRRVTTREQACKLAVPKAGDGRTPIYIETVRLLKTLPRAPLALGGCIGPFSLAARLVGMSEAMELTLSEPGLIHVLLEKCTIFLSGYARAFRQAGADGLIMAEPAAGLLSPRSMSIFSSAYIKTIATALADGAFSLIVHNCAARLPHLPSILETGLQSFHFGAPMDLPAALGKVGPGIVLCGNLDPAGVFLQLSPAEIGKRAEQALCTAAAHPNFVLSSGCDLPAAIALEGLDAFYEALR